MACFLGGALGSGFPNCELCDDRNTSNCGTCNSTCGTVGALGPNTCPVGTPCVDDDDCTGTCDPLTRLCVAECGNGVTEPGDPNETCDDGNTAPCGPCNATCSGVGAGTCPVDTGCNDDAVCTSGMCVDQVCVP